MKRVAIVLATLGVSISSLAALPATTDPTLIAVPQLPGGFVIGASAFYLQPSAHHGDLDYASVASGTSAIFAGSLKNVEPGYDWSWSLNIGYIFPNTGNDVNLSYFHLDTDNNDSISVNDGSNIIPINFVNPELEENVLNANAKAEYNLNQVDLTAGQFLDVGCRLILHPFVGLRWAEIERDLKSRFVEFSAPSGGTLDDIFSINEKSNFDGIGPLVGADASYYIGLGFGIVSHFDSALLIGNIDSQSNVIHIDNIEEGNPSILFTTQLKKDDIRRIVPVLDAKLGADYTYVFNNAANSHLTFEVGWMFSNYFNAVDRLSGAASGGITTTFITKRTTSDLSLNGPYVNITFHA